MTYNNSNNNTWFTATLWQLLQIKEEAFRRGGKSLNKQARNASAKGCKIQSWPVCVCGEVCRTPPATGDILSLPPMLLRAQLFSVILLYITMPWMIENFHRQLSTLTIWIFYAVGMRTSLHQSPTRTLASNNPLQPLHTLPLTPQRHSGRCVPVHPHLQC